MFTPPRLRVLPLRQILAAHVGAYGRAIKVELNCLNPCPVHVENLCTDYNARMRALHYVTEFEKMLKADIEDID